MRVLGFEGNLFARPTLFLYSAKDRKTQIQLAGRMVTISLVRRSSKARRSGLALHACQWGRTRDGKYATFPRRPKTSSRLRGGGGCSIMQDHVGSLILSLDGREVGSANLLPS